MTYVDVISTISAGVLENRSTAPLFFGPDARKPYHYLIDDTSAITHLQDYLSDIDPKSYKRVLTIPLIVDTEFYAGAWKSFWLRKRFDKRQGVTVQCMGAFAGHPRIFAHPQHALYAKRTERLLHANHPVALQEEGPTKGGFIGADYLRAETNFVQLVRAPWKLVNARPKVQFAIYAHFALAELYMMFAGEFLADIDARVRAREIVMGRRLLCSQKRHDNAQQVNGDQRQTPHDYVSLPWLLRLNNVELAVELAILDTAAIHGPVSLETFCNNVGLHLQYKQHVKHEWITQMHELYWADRALFEGYSLEDLLVYEALLRNARYRAEMYAAMDMAGYCTGEPKGTMGRNSQVCFQAMMDHTLQIAPGKAGETLRKAVLKTIHRATASYLASLVQSTARLLAKVEGGRCRNNQPRIAYVLGPIADIDISSCYGEGLALQPLPIGTPVIISYDRDTPYNEYLTLREFRAMVGHDLVPGLWHARVALAEKATLTHPQDFLGSWFEYKEEDIREQLLHALDDDDDKDPPIIALTVRSGCLKILRHEIRDAVITSDFFEWLDHVCPKAQRKELLDKLYVKAACYYPASEEKPTYEQLQAEQDDHSGKNTVKVFRHNNKLRVQINKEDYHGWLRLNLGDMGVRKLLELRRKHEKGTPLNTLLKLTINALYGDSVSQYFKTSNMCVGNNITARARAMAWYMEKGLNMFQTITDGGTVPLNQVVYPDIPRNNITAQNVADICRVSQRDMRNRLHLCLAPLGGYDRITTDYIKGQDELYLWRNGTIDTILKGDQIFAWIDTTALAHLQQLFPHATVLTQFKFETKKGIYHWATFHGSANYHLYHPDLKKCITRGRSYERDKEYETFLYEHDELIKHHYYDGTTPIRKHLTGLSVPDRTPRPYVFGKDGLLKDGEYRVRYKDPDNDDIRYPGENIYKCGLLCEFNLAQFHYNTIDQFKAVRSQWQEFKRKYGQYVEMLFLNPDGTLDYARMIEEVDAAIISGAVVDGRTNLMEYLDPGSKKRMALSDNMYHPAFETLQHTRLALAHAQGLSHEKPEIVEDQDSHMDIAWDYIPYELTMAD